jgi:hypothetical protein
MEWRIRLTASSLVFVLMLAGCATVATGSGQAANPPYQQSECWRTRMQRGILISANCSRPAAC